MHGELSIDTIILYTYKSGGNLKFFSSICIANTDQCNFDLSAWSSAHELSHDRPLDSETRVVVL